MEIVLGNILVSLSANWEERLKELAEDHDIDVGRVITGLCEWALSNSDDKNQFETWLDKTYSPKGQAEDRARAKGEEASMREENRQDEAEEEAHEDRNYNEDRL